MLLPKKIPSSPFESQLRQKTFNDVAAIFFPMESLIFRYRAFFLSVFAFCGSFTALSPSFICFLPFLFFLKQKWIVSCVTTFLIFFLYTFYLYPPLEDHISSNGTFRIKNVKVVDGPFHKKTVYYGVFSEEHDQNISSFKANALLRILQRKPSLAKNVPCIKTFKGKEKKLELNTFYRVDRAKLNRLSTRLFYLEQGTFTPIKKAPSLLKARIEKKNKAKQYLHKYYKDPLSYHLVSCFLTGEIENKFLLFSFSKLGLSHLLVISGFHFALIAGFLRFSLKKILFHPYYLYALLALLFLYFLFLGYTPSVARATIAISIFIVGEILYKITIPLHSLGIAGLACLTFDPLQVLSVSFQLSFLATMGIFLFYSPLEDLFSKIFPRRTSQMVLSLSHKEKYLAFLSDSIRSILSLNGAVYLATLPLIFFYFTKVSLVSFIYALFFPFLISLSLFLLVAGLVIPPIHYINAFYTQMILNLVVYRPLLFDIPIKCSFFTGKVVGIYLLVLVSLSFLYEKLKESPDRDPFKLIRTGKALSTITSNPPSG